MDARPVVYLVDDDESVLVALTRVLRLDGYEVRSRTSAREFLADHDPEVVGCLVCDLVMPAMNGLELQRELEIRGLYRSIVFLTGQGDLRSAVKGMKAGAVTFLSKPVTHQELLSAIREAVHQDRATRERERERMAVEQRLLTLTPRERQVLELVAAGLLNKQIAAKLGIAEKTIKIHRGRVMGKMRVSSVAALVGLLAPLARGKLGHPLSGRGTEA